MIISRNNIKMTDLYSILGVNKSSTDQDVKKAYRKLAMKWHPDKWSSATESEKKQAEDKFKEITEAYEILNDKDKRQKYDQYGMDYFTKGGQEGPDMSDFFAHMGGGFGMKKQKKKEPSIPHIVEQIDVSFINAFNGFEINISINRYDLKKNVTVDKSDIICSTCKGNGRIVKIHQMGLGMMQQTQQTCSMCKGEGSVFSDKFFEKKKHSFTFDVPKGIVMNEKIIIHNQGNQIPQCFKDQFAGQERSDVILVFNVENEVNIDGKKFTRGVNNNPFNIHTEMKIEPHEAICGANKTFKYLDNELMCIEIPSVFTLDEKIIVIQNKGMQYYKNEKMTGDLFITLKINKKIIDNDKKAKIWNILTNSNMDDVNKKTSDKTKNFINKAITIDEFKPSNDKFAKYNRDKQSSNDNEEQFFGGFEGMTPSGCTQQ